MGRIADADVVALALRYRATRPAVIEALGGEGRIGGTNEPPYPRLRVTNPPGDDMALRHLTAPLLQFEALGDPDLSTGGPRLRRALYAALEEMVALPEAQALSVGAFARLPGDPVVTEVRSTGGGGSVPDATGQPRYIATLRIYMHPGRD